MWEAGPAGAAGPAGVAQQGGRSRHLFRVGT
jgi:hypothetical protein